MIFVAELGDKSQLMALAFATRYPTLPVLARITVATAVVHAVSVVVGAAIGASPPTDAIASSAAWPSSASPPGPCGPTGDRRGRGPASRPVGLLRRRDGVLPRRAGWQDDAGHHHAGYDNGLWGTWLGSTVGMVLADALAIVVGRLLEARLPEQAIRYGAAAGFAIFGLALLLEPLLP